MNESCYGPVQTFFYIFGRDLSSIECLQLLPQTVSAYKISLGAYLVVFLLTCALELPFFFLANFRFIRTVKITGLLNAATHPAIIFLIPPLFASLEFSISNYILISEIFAPLTEFLILYFAFHVSRWRALVVAISANVFSWWIGPILLELATLSDWIFR